MAIALVAALTGLALAYGLYVRRPGLAARWSKSSPWLYDLVLAGYRVDDLYPAAVVGPLAVVVAAMVWIFAPGTVGTLRLLRDDL